MKFALTIPGVDGTPVKLDSGLPVPTGATTSINNILSVAIEIVLVAGVLLAVFFTIRGGINIITSGGHKEKFQLGRERVRYAFIGLILLFLSFFFLSLVGAAFNINFFP